MNLVAELRHTKKTMPAKQRYLTSLHKSFSTFLTQNYITGEIARQAENLYLKLLGWKTDYTQWSVEEVNQFLTETQINTPVPPQVQSLLTQFVKDFPPHQANIFLHEYLLAVKQDGCSPATVRNYRSDIRQYVRFSRTGQLKTLFTKPKLAEFVSYQLEKGLKESSITRKLSSISQFGWWLQSQSLLDQDLNWMNQASVQSLSGVKIKKINEKLAVTPTQAHFKPGASVIKPTLGQNQRFGIKKRLRELTNSVKLAVPNQTRRWLLPYLNLAFIVLVFMGLGYFGYRQLFVETAGSLAYPSSPTRPNRVLSFQGRLTDTAQNPLTTSTNMRFYLYDALSGGSSLWDSTTCAVTPDQDGIFTVNLGDDCGSEISQDVFSENANIWLEAVIEAETLTPRQPIRTVAYALNAETIQGYPIDSSGSATVNTILTMNDVGDVVLGEVSPKIKAVSGNFTLEGEALTLTTTSGSNGDITLDPDGLGGVVSTAYFEAPGATLSATYAGGTALTLRAGPTATANIMEWQNSAGTPLGVIDESGNLGVGTTSPGDELTVNGNVRSFAAGNNGFVAYDAATGGNHIFSLLRQSSSNNFQISSYDGIGFTTNATGGPSSSYSMFIESSGNVGIGTTNPLFLLDVAGTASVNSLNINDAFTLPTADGTTNYILQTDGSGTVTWEDPAVAAASAIYWDTSLGALYPKNSTMDLLIGGQASASAKFSVLNMNTGTPTASISGTTTNVATYITGEGNLATTNMAPLTLGGSTTGPIQLSPKGTTGLYVDDTGNVGIGTTSPQSNLHIKQTTGDAELRIQSGGVDGDISWLRFQNSTDNDNFAGGISSIRNSGLDHDLAFYTWGNPTGTERMRILNNGNVGIGTTSPNANLHISHSGSGQAALRIGDDTTVSNNTGIYLRTTGIGLISTGVGGDIQINPGGATAIGTGNGMRLEADGNVGIGTTSPGALFEVSGTENVAKARITSTSSGAQSYAQATGGLELTATGMNTTYKYTPIIKFGSTDPELTTLNPKFLAGIAGYATETYYLDTNSGMGIEFFTTDNSQGASTTPTSRMVIDEAGNVGIGTTSPGALLDVGGAKFSVTNGGQVYMETSLEDKISMYDNRLGSTDMYGFGVEANTLYSKSPTYHRWYVGTNADGGTSTQMELSSTRLYVNGNVGIGTTSPGTLLHLSGSGTGMRVRLDDTSDGDTAITQTMPGLELLSRAMNTTSKYTSALKFGSTDTSLTTTNPKFLSGIVGRATEGYGADTDSGMALDFMTTPDNAGASSVPTVNMTLDQNGNVGIGTTSPDAPLDVVGDVYISDGLSLYETAVSDGTVEATQFCTGDGETNCVTDFSALGGGLFTDGGDVTYLTSETDDLALGGTAAGAPLFFDEGAELLTLTNTTAGDSFRVNDVASDTTPFIIDADGDIGIGTINPGAKLHLIKNSTYNSEGSAGISVSDGTSDVKISIGADATNNIGYIQSYDPSTSYTTRPLTLQAAGGNVGIGTTSPGAKLDVDGTFKNSSLAYLSSGAYGSSNGIIIGDANYKIYSSSSDIYIDSVLGDVLLNPTSGNVGIGTTTPTEGKLVVAGRTYTTDLTMTTGASAGYYLTSDASGVASWADVSASAGPWTLSGTDLYPDDTSYNVGIGTTTPGTKLEVSGNYVAHQGQLYINANSGQPAYLAINADADQNTGIMIDSAGAYKTLIRRPASTNDLQFNVNGNDAMYITSTGNVGIGTTAPDKTLHVYNSSINTVARFQSGDNQVGFLLTDDAGTTSFYRDSDAGGFFIDATGGGTADLFIKNDGNVGIGTTGPNQALEVNGKIAIGDSGDGIILQKTSGLSSIIGIDTSSSAYNDLELRTTSGTQLYLDTSGNVGIGTTTPGAKLEVYGSSGTFLDVQDDGSSVFSVSETAVTSNLPTSFTSAGDVAIAYDLNFTNPTASYIKSAAPLYLQAGESYASSDLTLATYNAGDIIFDAGDASGDTGTIQFYDSFVKGATVTTPIAFSDSAADINTYRSNFTDETLVGAINETYSAVTGGGGGLWTDSGTNTYLTATGDNVGIGVTSPSYKLEVQSSDADIIAKFKGTSTVNPQSRVAIDTPSTIDPMLSFMEGGSTKWSIGADVSSDAFAIARYSGSLGGANEMFRISNTGNVGIGTTAPGSKFHISQSESSGIWSRTEEMILMNTDGSNNTWSGIGFRDNSNIITSGIAAKYYDTSNNYASLHFSTRGASGWDNDNLVVRNGNVGIGTATPGSKLEIGGASSTISNSSGDITLNSASGTFDFSGDDLTNLTDLSASGQIRFGNFSSDPTNIGQGATYYNTTDDSLYYYTAAGWAEIGSGSSLWTDAGASTYLTDTGDNVGIGTTAPGYNLEIQNTADAAIYLEADTDNATETDNAFLKLSQDGALNQSILGTVGNAGYDPENNLYTDAIGNATLLGTLNSAHLQFGTNDAVRMTISTVGNVGIGVTSASQKLEVAGYAEADRFVDRQDNAYYLDPASTGTSLNTAGDITVNGGSGKLNVGTIDPPYTINGEKYATYVTSMTGVKEETTGIAYTNEYVPGKGYRHMIDFSNQPDGSDIWLFAKTTDLRAHLNDLIVLLSPAGNTRAWYTLDTQNNQLSIYSSQPTHISYRLTAPRFDADNWHNTRDDEPVGFILNDPNDWEIDPDGTIFGDLAAAINEVFNSITAQTAQIDTLVTPIIELQPDTVDEITSEIEYATLEITDSNRNTVAEFNSQGDLTLLGELTAATISAQTINVTATISAQSARLEQLEARMAEFEHIKAQTAELIDATISGTLYATRIEGLDDQLAETLNSASFLDKLLGKKAEATESASLASLFTLVEDAGYATNSGSLINPPLYTGPTSDVSLVAASVFINDYFSVNGSGYVAQQLGIGEQLLIGNSLAIGDNYIEYQPIDPAEPRILHLQPSGQGTLSLMAGLMTLHENGQVLIDGDIAITGNLEIGGTLLTNLIEPTNFGQPLQLKLATQSGLVAGATATASSRFEILDQLNIPTATISATGRASFNGGINIGTEDLTPISTMSATVTSKQPSGKATIRQNTLGITIKSALITRDSLIYVSPIGSTGNQILYVKSQTPEDIGTLTQEGGFSVGFDVPISSNTTFNWWIIN